MLLTGCTETAKNAILRFARRQHASGYYCSQEGEWDSNGQALWICNRLDMITGKKHLHAVLNKLRRGADWICRSVTDGGSGKKYAGLLPPGFSAEHLGPNDYYYWDDYWAIAGLRAAAAIFKRYSKDQSRSDSYTAAAENLLRAVNRSMSLIMNENGSGIMPASPYRRPDSASVGSLVAGYPLQILDPLDPGLVATAHYLFEECSLNGALFHDVSHAGINPYLTLHIAQTFLRCRDERFGRCVEAIRSRASSTGQWPEAIHPGIGSGCMGDGQHVWAAAEWVCMLRNMFVREDECNGKLFLCSGLLPEWLVNGTRLMFGPAPTIYGPVTVQVECGKKRADISWDAQWHGQAPDIVIDPHWGERKTQTDDHSTVSITKRSMQQI